MKFLPHTILAALVALPGLAFSGGFGCSGLHGAGSGAGCGPTGYIFAYGGYSHEYNVDGNEPLFPSNELLNMDSGYIVGAGAGIYSALLNGSRFEIEGLHAHNDIGRIQSDIFDGRGYFNFGFRGELDTNAVMVNFLKEIPFCNFTGYVGGGVGFSENELTIYEPRNPVTGISPGTTESDEAFAYQFILGVDVPVTKCVDMFVQYKLLGVTETHFERIDLVIDNHVTHNMVVGARLSF